MPRRKPYRGPTTKTSKATFDRNARIPDNVRAMINAGLIDGRLVVLPRADDPKLDSPDYHPEPGDTLYLELDDASGSRWSANVTRLTATELEALQEFLNYCLDKAIVIARQRDDYVAERMEAGDDSYARAYRQLPRVLYRDGAEREHAEGIPERPDGRAVVAEPEP